MYHTLEEVECSDGDFSYLPTLCHFKLREAFKSFFVRRDVLRRSSEGPLRRSLLVFTFIPRLTSGFHSDPLPAGIGSSRGGREVGGLSLFVCNVSSPLASGFPTFLFPPGRASVWVVGGYENFHCLCTVCGRESSGSF